jgi:hypothetical protein
MEPPVNANLPRVLRGGERQSDKLKTKGTALREEGMREKG